MAWYTPHWPFKQQWEPDPLLVSDVHTVPPPTVRLQPYPPALTAGGQGWPEWPAPQTVGAAWTSQSDTLLANLASAPPWPNL